MANLDEQIVTTLFSQKDKTADTIMKHQPLLNLLQEQGRYKKRSLGYEIRKPARYNDTALGGFYTGYESFNLDSTIDMTAFRFPIKQVYEPFAISGREKRANRDQEQLLDVVDEKMEATLSRLKNTVSTSVLGDGTGFGSREFDGIKKMISTTPTSGTYAQVDRSVSANSWARNQVSNVTVTASNIQATITAAILPITRGSDWPDCGLMGSAAWKALHSSLTAIQRINDTTGKGKGGYKELYFDGVKFWYDGGFGTETLTNTSIYLMNSEYITFEIDSQADFIPLSPKMDRPTDQDAFFTVIIAEGNLCCSAPALQSVIYA
jgi:hypothetical protein